MSEHAAEEPAEKSSGHSEHKVAPKDHSAKAAGHGHEAHKHDEHKATFLSKEWFKNAGTTLKNRLGDAAYFVGSDLFVSIGSLSLPSSIATLMSVGNPLPAILSLMATGAGVGLGWQGVKKSPHEWEKTGFLAAQTLAAVAPTIAPELILPTKIGTILTTVLGMRHRTAGGHGGH